jgi:hypothetical protein
MRSAPAARPNAPTSLAAASLAAAPLAAAVALAAAASAAALGARGACRPCRAAPSDAPTGRPSQY